jgi:RNA polymerase sigma-70 factor (ECF subfamily)
MPQNEYPTDEELMERYRDGDAGAFDALYGRHKGGVFRYLVRQCSNRGTAEELFQDVWMNLIRARETYTVQAKFTTYLYRLAHNRLVDHYRAHAASAAESFDDMDGTAIDNLAAAREHDPALNVDVKQQAGHLLYLIESLPAAQREAFLLQQESDMSIDEIAQATGVSRETAKSRLRYAVAKLREGMRDLN